MGGADGQVDLHQLTVVVLGASGDLAKKKTFPALLTLFLRGFLPGNTRIFAYARSNLTSADLRTTLRPYLKGESSAIEDFLATISYVQGTYSGPDGFGKLQAAISAEELDTPGATVGRLYYLALPPSVYLTVVEGLKKYVDKTFTCKKSWLRIVVEKPFGKDLESSEALADDLSKYYPEEQVYRIDHYLGKEIAQNLIVLRFFNSFISPCWNRDVIDNVQICFMEPFGTEGRGGYFDEFGIIRDVIQNHLIQLLALITMERPASLAADDVRDEKVKVLECVKPIAPDELVLGQYVAANGQEGYLDDPGVPKDSKTPTFALCVLHIDNDRWNGVPFIIKAGKALQARKAEIRVQFKSPEPLEGATADLSHLRNELVIRVQPNEAIYMKMALKDPGLQMRPIMSELDLTYRERYEDSYIPEAYERLILDAMRGDQQHFVRRDELSAAWKIFTPILHAIDRGELTPKQYPAGSRGPPEADLLVAKCGYVRNREYSWPSEKVPSNSRLSVDL